MEETKMNKRKALRIAAPVIIILFILGIWVFKNYGTKVEETVTPSQTVGEETAAPTPTPAAEDDFALEATTLDLEQLGTYKLPIIIDFGADWCGPCRAFAPILDAMHEEMLGKAIIKYVDTDDYSEIAARFPVSVIPTQVFINSDGTPYQPSADIGIEFLSYNNKDSGELEFTVHQGGLTAEELRAILADIGVAQ